MQNKLDQFMADAGKLLATADGLYPGGLFTDDKGDPVIGVNNEAWDRYKTILHCLMAAKDAGGWNILDIRYDKAPSPTEDFAAVTVKLQGACTFTPTAKTALALATATADRVSITMDGDKLWLNFVVTNLWKNGGIE